MYISIGGTVDLSEPFFVTFRRQLHTLRIPETYAWLRTVVKNSPLAANASLFLFH